MGKVKLETASVSLALERVRSTAAYSEANLATRLSLVGIGACAFKGAIILPEDEYNRLSLVGIGACAFSIKGESVKCLAPPQSRWHWSVCVGIKGNTVVMSKTRLSLVGIGACAFALKLTPAV